MSKQAFDQIYFDVDSTLVTIEGLDWLASRKGVGSEVVELTKKSMDGELKMEEVFEKKMDLIAPSMEDMRMLGEKYCESMVKGAAEVINVSTNSNIEVYILTGNFYPAVNILAQCLGISFKNVIANEIYFDRKGEYVGFDLDSPLSKSGGKADILKKIAVGKSKVFVGDSVTDLDTKGFVDLFIGFGGVVQRGLVKNAADVYVNSSSMKGILKYVLEK